MGVLDNILDVIELDSNFRRVIESSSVIVCTKFIS